jgi:adenylate cyclase
MQAGERMSARETTVLFADVSGSTRIYEAAGDKAALEAIGNCIDTLRLAAEAAGGRIVKTIGDEVMVLFPGPDQAADAATRMHLAVDALPMVGEQKLSVRIGFHAGPVIQRENDVFGDTVNLASRLVEQATREQVLTSAETVAMMAPALRNATRRLYDITIRGKLEDVALCEFLWRKSPDITHLPTSGAAKKKPMTDARLRLRFGDREIVLRRRIETITLGRDAGCTFVIADATASRQHCVIEKRQGKFLVRDHSANGTYVTVQGEAETVLRREEMALRGHGSLAFGQPAAQATDLLRYWCE